MTRPGTPVVLLTWVLTHPLSHVCWFTLRDTTSTVLSICLLHWCHSFVYTTLLTPLSPFQNVPLFELVLPENFLSKENFYSNFFNPFCVRLPLNLFGDSPLLNVVLSFLILRLSKRGLVYSFTFLLMYRRYVLVIENEKLWRFDSESFDWPII